MKFTPEQVQQLSAKLDGSVVKQRDQAGRKLSYIEGWHAIAEANRIFGFDGWSRQTVETTCVWSGERQTRNGPKPAASYTARVRVTVGDIIREGTGAGSGFGNDHGEAHESAVKEAETDAMKRALMTFGNPFGLALYDKAQAEVEHGAPTPAAPRSNGHSAPARKAPAPVPGKGFDLLFPNGEVMANFKDPDEWCHGLRQAIEQPGAEVLALWERNKPVAEVIRDHYPGVQWADRKGVKYPAHDFLEAIVRKLTPGMAA